MATCPRRGGEQPPLKPKLLRSRPQLRQHYGPLPKDDYLTWALTKQLRDAAVQTPDSSSRRYLPTNALGPLLPRDMQPSRRRPMFSQESRGGRRALNSWNRHALPALCAFRCGI